MTNIQERLQSVLGVEQFVLIIVFCLLDLFAYKFLLRGLNDERHASLRRQFKELFYNFIVFAVAWTFQYLLIKNQSDLLPFYHYFGVAALLAGSTVFIRATRILVSEYLFFNSMTMGVPALLINIFTLTVAIFIAAWISTSIFGVRWAPLLATSAIVSVVLGLALQDTLGNLFAGVALQFDKPFEIGDWIEVHSENQLFVGEVFEINWRATTLYGFFDEVITIPNRMMAQSEVSNMSGRKRSLYRGVSLHLDPSVPVDTLKPMFTKVLQETPGVVQTLPHYIMLRDLNEKGAHWRVAYPIVHYSKQYVILDDFLLRVHRELRALGVDTSRLRVDAQTSGSSKASEASV